MTLLQINIPRMSVVLKFSGSESFAASNLFSFSDALTSLEEPVVTHSRINGKLPHLSFLFGLSVAPSDIRHLSNVSRHL